MIPTEVFEKCTIVAHKIGNIFHDEMSKIRQEEKNKKWVYDNPRELVLGINMRALMLVLAGSVFATVKTLETAGINEDYSTIIDAIAADAKNSIKEVNNAL